MYVILDGADVVIGFESREIPLENLVHTDFIDRYIFTEDTTLKVGDSYDRETGTFIATPAPEPEPEPEPQEPPLSEAEQTQLELAFNVEYLTCLMELND